MKNINWSKIDRNASHALQVSLVRSSIVRESQLTKKDKEVVIFVYICPYAN
jgi:hypothetical protein